MNEHYILQEELEKPRILVHLIGLGFMHLMMYSYAFEKTHTNFSLLVIFPVFILGFLACSLSWTERFRLSF